MHTSMYAEHGAWGIILIWTKSDILPLIEILATVS